MPCGYFESSICRKVCFQMCRRELRPEGNSPTGENRLFVFSTHISYCPSLPLIHKKPQSRLMFRVELNDVSSTLLQIFNFFISFLPFDFPWFLLPNISQENALHTETYFSQLLSKAFLKSFTTIYPLVIFTPKLPSIFEFRWGILQEILLYINKMKFCWNQIWYTSFCHLVQNLCTGILSSYIVSYVFVLLDFIFKSFIMLLVFVTYHETKMNIFHGSKTG